MEIGLGVDQGAGLTFDEQREVGRRAAQRGYTSCWTPAGLTQDSFHVCAQWHDASSTVVPGGLSTGISVVPVPVWTPVTLANQAATLGELTGGRFVLGIGSGGIQSAGYRQQFNLPDWPPIALMRDWLTVVRALLNGEQVTHEGPTVTVRGVKLGTRTDQTVPVMLGALGPQMLRLAGEASDGAALNWCNPEQVAWSRERVAAGAERAGRDPASVKIVEYIRICVDDDEDLARRALARAMTPYALAHPGVSKQTGYRAHFARMGFDAALTDLESRRDRGATPDQLADAFPTDLLQAVSYFGRPAGAAAAFARLAEGLDVAIVRVVPVRRDLQAVLAVAESCAPDQPRPSE